MCYAYFRSIIDSTLHIKTPKAFGNYFSTNAGSITYDLFRTTTHIKVVPPDINDVKDLYRRSLDTLRFSTGDSLEKTLQHLLKSNTISNSPSDIACFLLRSSDKINPYELGEYFRK